MQKICKRTMVKSMIKKIACVGIVLLLSGCSTVLDWGKKSFPQNEPIVTDKEPVAKYIRSEVIYDQFDTKGKFVALWLNDEVRTEYAKLHGRSRGSSPQQEEMLIKRQLDENKHFITFYVLSLSEVTLGEPESIWHPFLKINDTTVIVPTDIKLIDLPNEYKFFFGKHYTRFKIAYRILFDAKDLEDRCLIDATTQTLKLVVRSVDREVSMQWQIPSSLLHCTPGQIADDSVDRMTHQVVDTSANVPDKKIKGEKMIIEVEPSPSAPSGLPNDLSDVAQRAKSEALAK
jgi:hypothetical protein